MLITAAGSPNLSDTTGTGGTYSLTGFGSGSYTVTPSKTGGDNGAISSFDAAKISQYVVGGSALSPEQQTVADVSNTGGISSFDAALIARFVASLGAPIGSTANWIFVPASRNYPGITGDLTGENYSALLMGEISGNWTNGDLPAKTFAGGITVVMPQLTTPANSELSIPVNVRGISDKGIIACEFDLRYDPQVLRPQADVADLKGTVGRGLFAVVNSETPGLLRVVMYGPMPIDEDGVLLNLRFAAIGTTGSDSPLTFERIVFNDGELAAAKDGGLTLSAN